MSGVPYLGSKISLISKSEIRYEGILVDVNPQESTITFEQVRFFGTEGRRPGDEIAAMDRVFDCVVFRSADIKDLQVYETPAAAPVVKEKEPEFPDPAVVSFASSGTGNNSQSGFQYQSKSAASFDEVKMPKVTNYASAASQQAQSQSQNSSTNTKSFTTRNRSNYQHSSNKPRGVVVPKSEFDFSQANAKFSKEELAAMNSSNVETEAPAAPSYNKNLSFFDDISCQTNTESNRFADRNRNERHLNMETFGQAAPPRRHGYRGGRGRGGYRGNYNRGGYNNYNNNNNAANNDN